MTTRTKPPTRPSDHRFPFALSALLALGAVTAAEGCASPGPAPAGEPGGPPPEVSAPEVDSPEEPDRLRVVVLSDLNSSYGSTRYEPEVAAAVERTVRAWRPDLVLIAGDMVAGQKPSLDDDEVRAMWAAFDSVVGEPLRRAGIPLAVTLGNHDASGHAGHERDRRVAAAFWRDWRARPGGTASIQASTRPSLQLVDGGRFPFHYAFLQDGVFFLVLDASTGAVVADSAQMAWIRSALASEAARTAAMRVSIGHVPLYAVAEGRDRPGEVQEEPDTLRAALEAGGVHLHVSGHHHAYYPGRRGTLDLLHAGALGQGARPLLGSEEPPYPSVTVLDLFPAADSIAERTFRVDGDRFTLVDPVTLPPRIDGRNGFVTRRGAAGTTRGPITLVSYNIHAGKDAAQRPNLERVAAVLDSVGADIALLQEVDRGTRRSGGVDQVAELERLTGMRAVFGKSLDYDGGEYGIAVLSRWPILEHEVVPLPAEPPEERAGGAYEPRVALYALVETPGGPLPVIDTHLGAGAGTYRRQEVVGLLAAVHRRARAEGPVVVGGDLNARPESDEVQAATLALPDAWTRCGDGDGATYPAHAPDRRIDYLLIRGLDCTAARVPATEASDHRPLVVVLR